MGMKSSVPGVLGDVAERVILDLNPKGCRGVLYKTEHSRQGGEQRDMKAAYRSFQEVLRTNISKQTGSDKHKCPCVNLKEQPVLLTGEGEMGNPAHTGK